MLTNKVETQQNLYQTAQPSQAVQMGLYLRPQSILTAKAMISCKLMLLRDVAIHLMDMALGYQ